MWTLKKKNIFKTQKTKPQIDEVTIMILDQLVQQKKRIQYLEEALLHNHPEYNPYTEEFQIIASYQPSLPRPPPRNSSMKSEGLLEKKQTGQNLKSIQEEEDRNSWLEELYSVRKMSFRSLLSPRKMTKFPSFPNSEFE